MALNRNITLNSIPLNTNAFNYIADEALIQAVEIAIALNKPLVVSGEPGTGKTQLAHWVAAQLHQQTQESEAPFGDRALIFNTKSGSASSDLFYFYDAVSHFRTREETPVANFIELNALGLAIGRTFGKLAPELQQLSSLKQFKEWDDRPRSSVVLIDEIDKAPRDFPNDLLNEIENYRFTIKEMNQELAAGKTARIIVIMTSNSEKNLPNAFLRRCVFYHIPFPDPDKLLEIAKARMITGDTIHDDRLKEAIGKFTTYREQAINKKPATSEFLDWINVLKEFKLLNGSPLGQYADAAQQQQYRSSLNTLIKNKDDYEKLASR